jgi:hypothetical protein
MLLIYMNILYIFDFVGIFCHFARPPVGRGKCALFADAESEICFNFSVLRFVWGLYGGSENSVKFVTDLAKNLLRFFGAPLLRLLG